MIELHSPCGACGTPVIRINQEVIGCPNLGCKVKCEYVTEAACYREMIIEPLPLATKEGKVQINPVSSLARQDTHEAPKRREIYSIAGRDGLYTVNPGGRNGIDEVLHKASLGSKFASHRVAAKIITSTGVAMGRLFTPLEERLLVPVDMKAFCHEDPPKRLPGLAELFQLPDSPWLYASDGAIAVRVPADTQEEPETEGRVPPGVADLPWHPPGDAEWATWPAKSHYDDDGATRQKIGELVIDKHYDLLIRKLPAVRWTTSGAKTKTTIVFRFAGGEGVLMTVARTN